MLLLAKDPLEHTNIYQRALEDSEDSDGEGGLGNVNRIIVRPPGSSGKAKRGNLCFDAAFETGNLGRADLVGEFEYDLFLRPDTCNPRYRFWFNFTVDNVRQDQRVIFNIVNISTTRNLFSRGMTPLVKSTGRPKWQRLPKANVYYYKSAMHKNHYVMSFSFAFDREDEVFQFVLTFPYSYSRLQSYLNVLEQKCPDQFERSVIGNSMQNRKIELLTFDNVPKPERVDKSNVIHVIFILARIHPGEAPSSYSVQGLIEFLAIANHPVAKMLRDNVVFKILPMINPDGVFLGNNRCNSVGHDINRYWANISTFTHPTLRATLDLLLEYNSSEGYQIDFVIDIHAHHHLAGVFVCGNAYEDVYRYERHLVFPKLLAGKCDDFSPDNSMFNTDERKTGTARRTFCDVLKPSVNIYTLQVSTGGYYPKGSKTLVQYTEEGYYKIGRNLARAFLEYYTFTNTLPIPKLIEMTGRKGRPKTHLHRPRSKSRSDLQVRPKTTRAHAPISYTDLSMFYNDSSSNEGSPVRYPWSTWNTPGYRLKSSIAPPSAADLQYDLYSIQASKFSNLNFGGRVRTPAVEQKSPVISEVINVPPKPRLAIIDVNQLTRGSLEEVVRSQNTKIGKTRAREIY